MPAVALVGNLVVQEIIPDTTPSTPVVLPAASTPVLPETTPQVKPSFTEKLANHEAKPLATMAYTPVRVQQQSQTKPTGLLLLLAVLMSGIFFVFVTGTANQFVVSKEVTTIRVIFDPKPVQNFFLNLL
jgi:predicted Zn-dependent peptidase